MLYKAAELIILNSSTKLRRIDTVCCNMEDKSAKTGK